jgi:hypothetical protein
MGTSSPDCSRNVAPPPRRRDTHSARHMLAAQCSAVLCRAASSASGLAPLHTSVSTTATCLRRHEGGSGHVVSIHRHSFAPKRVLLPTAFLCGDGKGLAPHTRACTPTSGLTGRECWCDLCIAALLDSRRALRPLLPVVFAQFCTVHGLHMGTAGGWAWWGEGRVSSSSNEQQAQAEARGHHTRRALAATRSGESRSTCVT